MSIYDQDTTTGSGSGKVIAILLVVLLALGGAAYFFLSGEPEPDAVPVTEAPPPEPVEEAAPTPRPKRAPTRNASTTGFVYVSASLDGANVYLDGESVGPAPYEGEGLTVGSHEIRVEKEGYRPFVESVNIRGGRTTEVNASLQLLPSTLKIVSDVPGATVFIDRDYAGTTPLDVEDIAPGSHQITVSADGYDMYSSTVEIGKGHRDLNVSFKSAGTINESIAVVHKHGLGSCEGILIADTNGIRYETDHDKDGFSIPYGPSLERFEVDYIKKNMNLKIRDGKNYNFTVADKSGNADPLFVFHKNVTNYMEKL